MKPAAIIMAFLLSSLLVFPSCSDDGAASGELEAIDSPLQLTLVDNLAATRTISLRAATEKSYGCLNYSLVSTLTSTDTSFQISYDNVLAPNICLTALGPAVGTHNLGSLGSRTYTIAIKVNNTTVNGSVTLTDSTISVSGGNGRWSSFTTAFQRRVPRNFIWGNMQSNDPNAASVFRSFNDSLTALGAADRTYPSGDYIYFQLDGSGNVVPPGSGFLFVKTFRYQYSGDMVVLRELLRRYGQSHRGQLELYLYGATGESYQASVLANG